MAAKKPTKRMAARPLGSVRGASAAPAARRRAAAHAKPARAVLHPKAAPLSAAKPKARAKVAQPPQKKPSPVERRSGAERAQKGQPIRRAIVAGIVVAALALVSFVTVLVLSYTPVFTIEQIEAPQTEHIASEQIARLAGVEEGTTLLGVDEAKITANLRKNPWVGEVSYERVFPSTLKILVSERRVDAVAVMGSGNVGWAMGADGVWIEPVPLALKDGESLYDVALARAREMGALLICDLPSSVSPVAGSVASDECLNAVSLYRQQFSADFAAQIVAYSAPSVEGVMCTLASGVEVALGAPTDVESKEQVVKSVLQEHEGKVTYINVRQYARPSYRVVESDNVGQGSGALASSSAQKGAEGSDKDASKEE